MNDQLRKGAPPRWLDEHARQLWEEIVEAAEANNGLDKIDYASLASYCRAMDILENFEEGTYGYDIYRRVADFYRQQIFKRDPPKINSINS